MIRSASSSHLLKFLTAMIASVALVLIAAVPAHATTTLGTPITVASVSRVVFAPDGAYAYVSSSAAITKINVSNGAIVGTLPLSPGSFGGLAISPDGTRLFASITGGVQQGVQAIDATTLSNVQFLSLSGDDPSNLVVSPDGRKLYVAVAEANLFLYFDIPTDPLGIYIEHVVSYVASYGTSSPTNFVPSPDGSIVYLLTSDFTSASVVPINATTNAQLSPSSSVLTDNPQSVAINPSGTLVLVANYDADTLSIFDSTTLALVSTVPVGNGPLSVVVSPDGTTALVANSIDDSISLIALNANNAVTEIPNVGDLPYAVAMSSTGAVAYVAVYDAGVVQPLLFDPALRVTPSPTSEPQLAETGASISGGLIGTSWFLIALGVAAVFIQRRKAS